MANNNYIDANANYQYGNGAYGNDPYSPYGNGQYGNGQYGNGQYGKNGQYGNNQYNSYNNFQDPNDEEESSFNIMEWVFKVLHYWYLFVIGLVIAFGIASLKNRKWLPSYYSQGTIIIKETGAVYGGANSALMQGFGVDAGYKNVQNQLIMLRSYDLMSRTIDSLPFLQAEYITQGRFKTRNIYHNTPITVEPKRVAENTYGILFQVEFQEDGTLKLSSTDEEHPYSTHARYGEEIETPYFTAVIWPTERMTTSGRIFFRFRSHDGLVSEMISRLRLDFLTQGSTILAIGLVSETPERDCEVIDMLAKVFLLQNLEQKNAVADNSIRFITEQLGELQESLEVSENAMTNFRQENKFVDVSSYAGQLMAKVAGYDQELMSMRLRETYFDYLTNYLNTNLESGAVIAPTSMGLNDAALISLVQQINDLRIQRGELSDRNPYYAKFTKDIENVKTMIAEVVESMRASLNIEKQDLTQRYAEVEREIQKLPKKELQMVAIERNYRIDDNYYTFFLQKRAEAEIQKASNTPDNIILDKARTINTVNSSTRQKTTTTALIIGFLIPLILVIASELLNNKVRNPKEVEKLSPFRLIGTVRHAKSQNPTLVRDHPRSSYAEMLRSIRTRMEFVVKRKDKIVVAVTSTESGDGKTFLCSNLASLYALTGKKTILVDLDIRKPNIHTKLGLESGYGVTNYLIGDCELEDTFIKDSPFDFDIMRAGTIPPNPGELIHSDKLAQMINELRDKYDFIILDTSPIGLVPDAYALLEQADMGLFVIRCMQTNKSFCKQTLQQIAEVVDHPEKLQIVLSDIPTEGGHGTGYGYGYGYGYGGYGYGHRSSYGYGYGQKRSGLRYKYGKLYGKIFHKEDKNSYNYYSDDDV
ncbi:MAG: polysaccharide biosynthesis tyrosine autokinase [Paludibacteraceae bacterium]|nr:polysaccharide biosynthesis tyrosine autokinase [Paludibacteraceae bacterium]